MIRIRAPQDLGAGIIFLGVGFAGLYLGANLSGIGASGQLGSGTMPRILSWICLGFGALMLFRALRIDGPPAAIVPWRALASVTFAVILFGFLIERVGYVPTAIATPLIAAFGLPGVRWKEAALVAVLLGLGTALLFVIILGQPLKLWGGAQ
ncbi:hypothetical protein BB934_38115 (plasmid) [Microvirga ossetica]|uniref:DUF1468 domain-containing protein n=1 Tax=Microvirga ossetica TaxID=1882682 RepID=A0A1B2EVT8_9HYPH|nr:tripartite tricarboxylate transporter TctB family protein [Microvirga ossetica]ANY84077.1 hypothetical protein BB934_38115 [Microvirga ossetica]